MTSKYSQLLLGMKNELPIMVGIAPLGMTYGILARDAGLSTSVAQAMSSIVFAGSAQLIAIQFIKAHVPWLIIVLTIFVINIRHALYSASVASYLKRLHPLWQMLLAYLLTDEVYAVVITHYEQLEENIHKHWYFLGAGLIMWSTWQVSTALGIALGAHIPKSWPLDFVLPLIFIALIMPSLKKAKSNFVVAGIAGITAVLMVNLPFQLGIVIAMVTGIAIGCLKDIRKKVQSPAVEAQQHPAQAPLSNDQLKLAAHEIEKG